MSGPFDIGNRFYALSSIAIGVAMVLPLTIQIADIYSGYSALQDSKFRTHKVLQQYQISDHKLKSAESHLADIKNGFLPLTGSRSQASTQLQSNLTDLISRVDGTLESVTTHNDLNAKSDGIQEVSCNLRWNGDAAALANFLSAVADEDQNMVLKSINLRRRPGVSALIDVRMQVSALFENNVVAKNGLDQ